MTRIRTKKSRYRTRKYRKKLIARIINLIFKENVKFYSVNLRDYLRLDNLLEKETLDLLEKNIQLGLIKEEEKDLYLAFWRKVLSLAQDFTNKTLEERVEETLNEFVNRGLKEEKLKEIIELVEDQLSRKKIFEKTKEWATIQDYLKVKALAYVLPLIKFETEILPIRPLEFIFKILVLAYRVFNLLAKTKLEFYKYVLALQTRRFDINLVDKINVNLLYEIERLLEFTFWLRPKTILIFDYDVIAITFRRFSLITTLDYEFLYTILPLTTRVFEIKDFYTYQLLYSVTPMPYRVFNLLVKPRLSLITYKPTVKLMKQEITPLPKLLLIASRLTTEINKTEIKNFYKLEFSYSVHS